MNVGELGRLEGGYNLGSLISVLGPVPQHLHPGWSGDALPVVEVDRVVRAGLAHPVSTTVEGERVGGRVFLSDSGKVGDVEPRWHLGDRVRSQKKMILFGNFSQHGGGSSQIPKLFL